jgi:hypothetical protein
MKAQEQKFFGSFFQKRTLPVFCVLAVNWTQLEKT